MARTTQEIKRETEQKMKKTVEATQREFSTIRTGRAQPTLVEGIKVNYYNTPTPIKQLATISTPEARLIVINPWDNSIINEMERAIKESTRRREIQLKYNQVNHITPASIQKNIDVILSSSYEADYVTVPTVAEEEISYMTPELLDKMIEDLKSKMIDAASKLEFEEAARYRDRISALEQRGLELIGY